MKKTAMTTFIIGGFINFFILPIALLTGNMELFSNASVIGFVSTIVFWISIFKIVINKFKKRG